MEALNLYLSLQCPSCKAQLRSNLGWFKRNTECRYCNADISRVLGSHTTYRAPAPMMGQQQATA